MNSVTIDDAAFQSELKKVLRVEFPDLAWQDANDAANRIASTAKRYAPRGKEHDPKTPVLAETIGVTSGSDEEGRYIDVGTTDYIGVFQEFGTSHNAPHPFMRPAIEEEMG